MQQKNINKKTVFITLVMICSFFINIFMPVLANATSASAILPACNSSEYNLTSAFYSRLQTNTGVTQEQFLGGSFIVIAQRGNYGTSYSQQTTYVYYSPLSNGKLFVENDSSSAFKVWTPTGNANNQTYFLGTVSLVGATGYNDDGWQWGNYINNDNSPVDNNGWTNDGVIPSCVQFTNNIDYDTNFEAPSTPYLVNSLPKTDFVAGSVVNVYANGDVMITYDERPAQKLGLPQPDTIITGLETVIENQTNELLEADQVTYGYALYKALPLGRYQTHLMPTYDEQEVNDAYNILDSTFIIDVTGKDYTILYFPEDQSYCSINQEIEMPAFNEIESATETFNCGISQPTDETLTPINGTGQTAGSKTCDITHLTGCLDNVSSWVGNFFSWLFIPSPNMFKNALTVIDTNKNGVTAVIVSPLQMISDMQTASCTDVPLPLPFIDSDINLPCMNTLYTTYFGAFFTMYQIIVSGVISYWILVRILTRVKHAQQPKSNQIDVVNL